MGGKRPHYVTEFLEKSYERKLDARSCTYKRQWEAKEKS